MNIKRRTQCRTKNQKNTAENPNTTSLKREAAESLEKGESAVGNSQRKAKREW